MASNNRQHHDRHQRKNKIKDQLIYPKVDKEFHFYYQNSGRKKLLKVKIVVPLTCHTNELAHRLITAHNLPCYLLGKLQASLKEFVSSTLCQLQVDKAEQSIHHLKQFGPDVIKDISDHWCKCLQDEVAHWSDHSNKRNAVQSIQLDNGQSVAQVYHALIHSPAMEAILQLECTYASVVKEIVKQRNTELEQFEIQHQQQLEIAIQSGIASDRKVSRLAAQHMEELQFKNAKWNSTLSDLMENQKREFYAWMVRVYNSMVENNGVPTERTLSMPHSIVATLSRAAPDSHLNHESNNHVDNRMEESFTIYLGTQKKTMHNIRLMIGHPLDLCRSAYTGSIGSGIGPPPQRIQTALSLYSSTLNGLILLVDDKPNCYTGIKNEFAMICEESSEFHFLSHPEQLHHIRRSIQKSQSTRAKRQDSEDNDIDSLEMLPEDQHSYDPSVSDAISNMDSAVKAGYLENQRNRSATLSSLRRDSFWDEDDDSVVLALGDFYSTHHSNLSDIHVVYHLVVNDDVKSDRLPNRHPILTGLRNALNTAASNDVTTITIPLLLVNEMTEEMTISWCVKRAELIFKCVKGFMMENEMWSNNQACIVQFLIPKGISEEMFNTFTGMLPGIFRMAAALNLSTTAVHE
ncbi:Protein C12orf4-like protein [Trichoplax sp. H2]|nr:Protein C12orf4-like protein [Trichoplax sp. H2]|eukprot:RDD38951.1 Protein C12orf4-like protein [Trichoplax sp. H2]